MVVSPNGTEVYVAELDPHRICKFRVQYKNSKLSETEERLFPGKMM